MNRSKSVFSPSLMGTSRWLLGAMLCLSALLRAAEPLAVQEWEGLVPDPALVVDGKPALAWANPAERTTVTAQNLAHDLSGFHTLRFRIHVAEPRDSVISLIFDSGNPDTPKGDYYSVSIKTDFSGWRTFEFPLSLIGSTRKPLGWHAIRKVFFNSMWSHHFEPDTVVHLAGFVLDPTPIPGLDQPVGELLKNRGFEIVAGSRPAAWSVSTYSSAARAETDDAEASSGQRSLHIVGAPSARAGASVSFGSELTDPNSLYLLSAQVKVEGTSQHALRTSARFTSVDVDGKVVKSDYKMCPLGPFDWRALAWIVQLPPATHRFNLVLFHHGEGGVWWDDVSLLKLRPVKALAPAVNVASADCRPEFRWEAPADSASTLVVTAESGSDFHVSYDVIGNRFRPEKAFPEGRSYRWHVIVSQGDEPGLAGFKGEDGYMQGTFFAGSFARRVKIMLGDLAPYRKLYAELKPFADRNGMWDRFSLLGDLLANVDSLERDGRLPEGVNLEKMLQDAQELRLRAPWWRKIFLDTGSLMADLDLERPGLEQVREAVGKGDFRAARETLVAYYRQRKAPSYYQKWERRPSINPARTTDTRAEKLLTHKMSIHSYKEPTFDLGREFDWHIFPIVDVEWPTKIHRNFHWSKLAGAYWATDNEAYANEMVQQLLDFAQDNPMERWDRHRHRWAWSTLNATVRIYSTWLNSWLRVRGSKSWTADAQFVMLTELREHGRFLMTHHARHGNWVVAEARGLVELGVMFPEFKEAAEWRAEGFQRLLREIDIQVLSDGVHVERTPGYHSMTMSCFLEPLRLAMLNDVDFEGRENFLAKIESMYEFYLYGARPDLRMAQIGDGGMMNVVSRLTQGANFFLREDMRNIISEGKEGVEPVHRSHAFEAAGFYVSRSGWNDPDALWSIMDWGGFLGHCHLDMGHISLYAYGAPLLVDSGRFAYAWPERKYFIWTTGHNTVVVDDKPQKHRDPLSCTWVTTNAFDLTRGLTDNSEPLRHERTLVFKQPGADGPGYWVVLDRLTGEGKHKLDQRWHPGKNLVGTVTGATARFSGKPDDTGQPSLVVAGLPQSSLTTAIVEGWVSYKWYKKDPVDVAQFTQETAMPAVFANVLYPTPPAREPASVRLTALPATLDGQAASVDEVTAFRVEIADNGRSDTDIWIVRHENAGVAEAGGFELDGRLARIRVSGDGLAWFAAESAKLSRGGTVLFSTSTPADGVALVDNAISCTAAQALRIAASQPCTVNGGDPVAPTDGVIALAVVTPPATPPVPRAEGEISIALPPPPEDIKPSGFAKMLSADEKLPAGALLVNAAEISGQGRGRVEVTSGKVGALGKAFLHWDRAGHWLEYTFRTPRAGKYLLFLRACTSDSAVLRKITIDGSEIPVGKALEIAGTGGYSSSQDDWRIFVLADGQAQPTPIDLPVGKFRVRLENIDGRSLNLNWIALAPAPPQE